MDSKNSARYFLGSNSRDGFYSLYNSFADFDAGDFLWIIKGGPGCGKSSFMKRIGRAAEAGGLSVEYIHCSGDPDSLDGLWLPSLRIGYVDGTAPHTIDAVYPGAASLYLDLGTFYDAGALEHELGRVAELTRRGKALYSTAYAHLAAAGALDPRVCSPGLWGGAEREKLIRRANGFAARELRGGHSGSGTVKHRFLSAISCKGRVLFGETLENCCERLCRLDNGLGMGWFFLDVLTTLALERGLSVTLCHDPLFPDKTEAIILPDLSLGLIAGEPPEGSSVYRHMRLDALADKTLLAAERPRLRALRRQSAALLSSAVDGLARAKEVHDLLEQVYNPHVDFDGLYAAADDHISWLLGDMAAQGPGLSL